MPEDRLSVSLALDRPGSVRVFTIGKQSRIHYATQPIPFDPIPRVIEVDMSQLPAPKELTRLTVVLEFPEPWPEGEIDLLLKDERSESRSKSKFTRRAGERVKTFTFDCVPRSPLTVRLSMGFEVVGGVSDVTLGTFQCSKPEETCRWMVSAASCLSIFVSGRDDDEGELTVYVFDERGLIVEATTGARCDRKCERMPAGTYFVQAVAWTSKECSKVREVRVAAGSAHTEELALEPGGQVRVGPMAFGDVRFLDVDYGGGAVSRVFFVPSRETTFWLPEGAPQVRWQSGSKNLSIVRGVVNTWAQ
jgi:hypothetical protein